MRKGTKMAVRADGGALYVFSGMPCRASIPKGGTAGAGVCSNRTSQSVGSTNISGSRTMSGSIVHRRGASGNNHYPGAGRKPAKQWAPLHGRISQRPFPVQAQVVLQRPARKAQEISARIFHFRRSTTPEATPGSPLSSQHVFPVQSTNRYLSNVQIAMMPSQARIFLPSS